MKWFRAMSARKSYSDTFKLTTTTDEESADREPIIDGEQHDGGDNTLTLEKFRKQYKNLLTCQSSHAFELTVDSVREGDKDFKTAVSLMETRVNV